MDFEPEFSVFVVDSEGEGVHLTAKLGYKSVRIVINTSVDRAGGIFRCD